MSARPKPIDSRTKGASAEREFARVVHEHLGVQLVRKLEQYRKHAHDLCISGTDPVSLALDGYAIEVKRYRILTPGLLATFWKQAEDQAERCGKVPVLAYRADRHPWRVVLPLHVLAATFQPWPGIEWTATLSLEAFCTFIRETTP